MAQIDFTQEYWLTAAQCNAQRELPLSSLIRQIIDVATEHANRIGVGAARLAEDDNTWVLSRISIVMDSYPRMHHSYSITTWIESFARFFSERNFVIRNQDGNPLGYVRTVWICINRTTHRPADISALAADAPKDPQRPCPIPAIGKLHLPDHFDSQREYTFRVCDIDFNRHVNAVVYTSLIIDQLDLDTLDRHFIRSFDINYQHESFFGETVTIASQTDNLIPSQESPAVMTLSGAIMRDTTPCVLARLTLAPR